MATSASPVHMHNAAIPESFLEHGDRLSRSEFERRYERMKTLKKAELIEGTVYLPSPVRARKHGKPRLEMWPATLKLGAALPVLPLWIAPDRAVPLDLEASYTATCESLRMP